MEITPKIHHKNSTIKSPVTKKSRQPQEDPHRNHLSLCRTPTANPTDDAIVAHASPFSHTIPKLRFHKGMGGIVSH